MSIEDPVHNPYKTPKNARNAHVDIFRTYSQNGNNVGQKVGETL